LVPEFLAGIPLDIFDGQPLRYRPVEEGHCVVYSIGLDCVDNGGEMLSMRRQRLPYSGPAGFGIPEGADLVWFCSALSVEAAAHRGAEQKAWEEQKAQAAMDAATDERQRELSRRARVEELLAMRPTPRAKEPTFDGQPLSKLLRNTNAPGTLHLGLEALLTLTQIGTPNDSGITSFEVPIRYDVVTNIGGLRLLVDAESGDPATSDEAALQECTRATNGNCLLIWNTTYDPPGQHALQAQLHCTEGKKGRETIYAEGTVRPYFSSNLFQLDSFSAFSERGAYLRAKLAESTGTYAIELKSPFGNFNRTFVGSTTSGVIEVFWDLIDEHGQRYTNDSFDSTFNVTLPDSGRSNAKKGP